MEDKSKKSKRSRGNSFGKDEELLFLSEIENFYYRFIIFFLQPSKKRDIYASLSSQKYVIFDSKKIFVKNILASKENFTKIKKIKSFKMRL
jgi:hypothetical protein